MNTITYPDNIPKYSYYIYMFTIDSVVRYVGKGKGRRIFSHERDCEKSKSMWHTFLRSSIKNKKLILVEIVGVYDTNSQASAAEIELISKHGRRYFNEGTLMNYQNGGQGGDSVTSKLLWEDPQFRKKCMDKNKTQETKSKRANVTRSRWENPTYKKDTSSKMKDGWNKPEVRTNKSISSKKLWESSSHREHMSNIMKNRWATGTFKKTISDYRTYMNKLNSIASKFFDVKYTKVTKEQRNFCEALYLGLNAL